MGLLRRRLIFAKDFDMNKFSMDKIWSVSTLEDARCITFVCLPLGYILVMCYITYTSTFWQLWHFMHWDSGCLSQLLVRNSAFTSESWSSMRWVKFFFCYIDRWFVFEKQQDHNLIVHLVFKKALYSMTCIVNPSTAREEMKLQSAVELSFLTVSGW